MTDQPTNQPTDHVLDSDRPSGRSDRPPTDQPTRPTLVSLEDAALTLGITVNAVRQRIKRGTLAGVKTDAGWLVDVVATNQRPGTDRPTRRPTDHTTPPTDHQPTIDLAPLVTHIASLEDQLQRLTEASTMWQVRARQAEERLQALGAGSTPQEAVERPPRADSEPRGMLAWVKRVLSG